MIYLFIFSWSGQLSHGFVSENGERDKQCVIVVGKILGGGRWREVVGVEGGRGEQNVLLVVMFGRGRRGGHRGGGARLASKLVHFR